LSKNFLPPTYMDESPRQTQDVVMAAARRYAPDREAGKVDQVIERHHRFQTSLKPIPVVIPYWKSIGLNIPSDKPESRRVIQQVMSVIEVVCLLRNCGRETKGSLVATVDDYAFARKVLLGPVHNRLGLHKVIQKIEVRRGRLARAVGRDGHFTQKMVRVAMGYKSDMGASGLVGAFLKSGIAKVVREKHGSTPAFYCWTGKEAEMVLPTVEKVRKEHDIREAVGARNASRNGAT
jgi:hypothetical protein